MFQNRDGQWNVHKCNMIFEVNSVHENCSYSETSKIKDEIPFTSRVKASGFVIRDSVNKLLQVKKGTN
jgi:magnesium-transporting ATPase (P-type)